MTFEGILIDNYEAVKARGLINEFTTFNDFKKKLLEEIKEMENEFDVTTGHENKEFESELIDCICVITNMALHYGIDIKQGLINNAIKNWDRCYK
jgi:uncharacterized protein YabN with tetrapyrrole methylase and pyrophosphatase domain